MKKISCLVLALALIFSLSACGGKGGSSGNSKKNAAKSRAPSEAYEEYTKMKSTAYDSINEIISEHTELALSVGLALFPIVSVDLTLIPLTMIGSDGGELALAFLGMGNIKIDQNGDKYTIKYTDSKEVEMIQTCEFDAAADSMRSIISDAAGSLETMIFEYTKSGDGYVSQYCMYQEQSGEYMLIKMYFNADGDVAIGIETVSSEPDSIYKKTGLTSDFAKNDSFFVLLQAGKLTVTNNGETKTY